MIIWYFEGIYHIIPGITHLLGPDPAWSTRWSAWNHIFRPQPGLNPATNPISLVHLLISGIPPDCCKTVTCYLQFQLYNYAASHGARQQHDKQCAINSCKIKELADERCKWVSGTLVIAFQLLSHGFNFCGAKWWAPTTAQVCATDVGSDQHIRCWPLWNFQDTSYNANHQCPPCTISHCRIW